MTKVISFGKIAYNSDKKENEVIIEIELSDDEQPVLSISGEVWNRRHDDSIIAGQCLDELKEYFTDNWKFMEIYRLWKLYHLNNLHAGTIAQEELLKKYCLKLHRGIYDYKEACKILEENNLYNDNGYIYGTDWLYREIPDEDLVKIKEIIETW